MGQASAFLRNTEDGFTHWCPGCMSSHFIPVGAEMGPNWGFNGNVDAPSFTPSVRIGGNKLVRDAEGKWTGEWERDAAGNLIPAVCHYFITDGKILFCSDSTHALSGQTIPLPALPSELMDSPMASGEFDCKVCGVACPIAPADGSGAICVEHCEDHDYAHDPNRRAKFCRHCDAPQPEDMR